MQSRLCLCLPVSVPVCDLLQRSQIAAFVRRNQNNVTRWPRFRPLSSLSSNRSLLMSWRATDLKNGSSLFALVSTCKQIVVGKIKLRTVSVLVIWLMTKVTTMYDNDHPQSCLLMTTGCSSLNFPSTISSHHITVAFSKHFLVCKFRWTLLTWDCLCKAQMFA